MPTQRLPLVFSFLLLLLFPPPPPATALQLYPLGTLFSLSNSLLTRVANARAARGDRAGAARAAAIADKFRLLGGGGGGIWSLGWDFARNYAWRGGLPSPEISRAAAELVAAIVDVARLDSSAKRADWAIRNSDRVLRLSNSLFRSLLRAFSREGPLRELVLVVQREVVEGELLKDCLEVGANDLDGLIRVAKELFISVNSRDREF